MSQNVPHWLVQGMDSFSNQQIRQSLEWATRNYNGQQLADAYKFARYFRPAYSRGNQFLVDRMGEKAYREGASLNGYRTGVTSMGQWYDPVAMTTEAVKQDQQKKAEARGETNVWDFMGALMEAPAAVTKEWAARQPGSQTNPGGWTGQNTPSPSDFVKFGEEYGKWVGPAATTPLPGAKKPLPSWLLPAGVGLAAVLAAAYLAS